MRLLPLKRLVGELRRVPTAQEIEASLASLTFDTRTATISRAAGTPLFDAEASNAGRVHLAPTVYTSTPTAAARIRMLAAAARLAPEVDVHAPALAAGTHRGRLAIDLPRRTARALGLRAAEPGDRFTGGFVHALYDDEAIVEEGARAGLAYVGRHGAWVRLERARYASTEHAAPFAVELMRVLAVIADAERLRSSEPPERAVQAMRERGRRAARRGPIGRARLRRAIGWVDAARRPNCFRRTLVEIGLDAGAARETLVFGLDVGRTGHVALKDAEEVAFDVAFEIPAEEGR